MNISWKPPEPRKGFMAGWDKFVGPGATDTEEWLQLLGGGVLFAGVVVYWYLQRESLAWSPVQWILVGLLALDIIGGIITNATSTAKRWYHREGMKRSQHMGFILTHGVHLLILTILFPSYTITYFLTIYAYLIIGSYLILSVPLYIQRPVAMIVYCAGMLAGWYLFETVPGLEWFLPFFFLKLLINHLTTEAPFRPASETLA